MSFVPSTCTGTPSGCGCSSPSPFSMPSKTSMEWALANPVLNAGATAYESDTGKWKIGDGVRRYMDLQYQSEVGTPGAAGVQGDIGPVGPVGPPCNLRIGSVTEGDTAAATITGTSPNYTLNLVLPSAGSTTNPTDPVPPVTTSVTFTEHPQSTVVVEADAVVMTATATASDSSALTYKWQRQAAASSSWVDFSFGRQLVFNAALANNNDSYRCAATSATLGIAYSIPAGLKVFAQNPANPKFVAQPLPVFTTNGSAARFSVAIFVDPGVLTITGYTYQWSQKPPGGSWSAAGTGQVLSVTATTALNGYEYRCAVTVSVPGGILGGVITSNSATLTVT